MNIAKIHKIIYCHFKFDNLQNSNNVPNLTKNEELLANDKNGQFWFLLQNINVTENKKSKKHKTRSKKEITIDDTKEIFNKSVVISYINKLSKKDASWKSEIRTTNVSTIFIIKYMLVRKTPLQLAGMNYLSLPLFDVNNTKEDLLASILYCIDASLTRGIKKSQRYNPSFSAVIQPLPVNRGENQNSNNNNNKNNKDQNSRKQ